MAKSLDPSYNQIPFLVVIGVPDKTALFRVINKLKDKEIGYSVFSEPDDNLGLTAVATVPLTQEQRRVLSNYGLWKYAEPAVPAPNLFLNFEGGLHPHENMRAD